MTGQENRFRRILDKYIDSIDNGNENRELIMKLEDESVYSAEAKNCYEEARLAQLLYYGHLISIREPVVIDSLVSTFKEKRQCNIKHNNIWEYLNSIIESKDLSWEQILKQVKMNPGFAVLFKKGEMNLNRVAPEKLAQISNFLNGDANQVIQLAYQWFRESKKPETHTFGISYREVSIGFNVCDGDSNQNAADQEKKLALRYIQKLEKALS